MRTWSGSWSSWVTSWSSRAALRSLSEVVRRPLKPQCQPSRLGNYGLRQLLTSALHCVDDEQVCARVKYFPPCLMRALRRKESVTTGSTGDGVGTSKG